MLFLEADFFVQFIDLFAFQMLFVDASPPLPLYIASTNSREIFYSCISNDAKRFTDECNHLINKYTEMVKYNNRSHV